MTRLGLGISPGHMALVDAGGAPAGPETDPNVTAVQADGWRVTYTSPPAGDFDSVNDPRRIVVQSPGYDANANPVTVTRTPLVLKRVRQPYDQESSLTANDVSSSEYIYDTDVIAGVTNNSTRRPPKPILTWLSEDHQHVKGGTFSGAFCAAHGHARNGRALAACKVIARDGSANEVSVIINSETVRYFPKSGLYAPVWEFTLDVSSLDADVEITVDIEAYPWVGEVYTVSTDAEAHPSPNMSVLKFLNDKNDTYGTTYAAVNVGASGGSVSLTEAGADADPYPTIAAAAAAIQVYNDNNNGRNNASGGTIRLLSAGGAHIHSSFSSVAVGEVPLNIVGVGAGVVFGDAGVSTNNSFPDKFRLENLTLRKHATGNVIFVSSGASGATAMEHYAVFKDVTVDLDGEPSYDAWVYTIGRGHWENCDGENTAQTEVFSTAGKTAKVVGCNGDGYFSNGAYSCVGTRSNIGAFTMSVGYASRPAVVAPFMGWNWVGQNNGATWIAVFEEPQVSDEGCAIVGNIFEKWNSGSPQVCLALWADGIDEDVENIVCMCNTVLGSRTNIGYENKLGPNNIKSGYFKFNVFEQFNCKSDVFAEITANTGNWSIIYKVDMPLNVFKLGSQGGTTYYPGSWMGENAGVGEVTGDPTTPVVLDFADDQSANEGGAGDGDYTPGASTAIPLYGSAALVPQAFDLNGDALSASSHVGAIA